MSDVIQIFGLIGCIIIMWFQRKTIFQLEQDNWELEKTYKEMTGKDYEYLYRRRQYQLSTEEWIKRRKQLEDIFAEDEKRVHKKRGDNGGNQKGKI